MTLMLRIFRFIALAALGYAGIFIVYGLGPTFHDRLSDVDLHRYSVAYLGGGSLVAIIGTGLGIISFFTAGRLSRVFLLLPCVAPIAYCIGVMLYFSR